ncbi:hypothetical protein [Paraburkholderia strydomiana]|uniref:hypothetical protein n=1 Tax=Paraburkholderia strydomiana TaxID=1245417 RepID=UPI00285B7E2C|nr:hypothetical protein [Paraburkholderia strydomiana]MDR7009606.1 hypothetical protein [Paraburkholderia strydomiana]
MNSNGRKYAVSVLLQPSGVRYLPGQPWQAVNDAVVVEPADDPQIDPALPLTF